jgi:hypothetical protein
MSADVFTPLGFGGELFPALAYSNTFTIAVGAASVAGNTFVASAVTMVSTTNCWVNLFGNAAAVGATGSMYLPANQFFTFSNTAGSMKLSVIQDTVAGTLCYMPAAKG